MSVVAAGLLLAGQLPARAVAAYIRLAPTGVATGEQVTVYGLDFCSAAQCSPVRLTAREDYAPAGVHHPIAEGVAVAADGSFQHRFSAALEPGSYTVTASQSDGTDVVSASAALFVHPGDEPAGPRPGGTVSTGRGSPAPPAVTTPPPSPRPTATSPAPSPTAAAAASSPTSGPTPSATPPAQDATTAPVASAEPSGSDVGWWLAAAAVAAVLAGVLAGLVRRRRGAA